MTKKTASKKKSSASRGTTAQKKPGELSNRISAVVEALDRADPRNWTATGLPKVAVVSRIIGSKVTRAQISKSSSIKSRGKSRAPSDTGKTNAARKSTASSRTKPQGNGSKTQRGAPSKSAPQRSSTDAAPTSSSGPQENNSTGNARAREDGATVKESETVASRPVHRRDLTVDQVISALRAVAGVRSLAADRLGVTRGAITKFAQRHPEVVEAEQEIREQFLDLTEGKLLEKIRSGDGQSIRYYLDSHGAERGYGKKVVVSGDPDKPLHTKDVAKADLADLLREGKLTRDQIKTLRDIKAKLNEGGEDGPASP